MKVFPNQTSPYSPTPGGSRRQCTSISTGWNRSSAIPVIRVSNGNIKDDILRGENPGGSQVHRHASFPSSKTTGKHYVGTRQCTKQYKLKPIHRYLRQHLGLVNDGRKAPKDQQVDMWLGLSRDEVARIKPSKQDWITLVYPLIERDHVAGATLQMVQRTLP